MAAIADHTNTMKRCHEAAVYIQEIQSQLTGWEDDDLSSYGDLLLEVRPKEIQLLIQN